MERRQIRILAAGAILLAGTGLTIAQTDPAAPPPPAAGATVAAEDDGDFDMGWIGLLGLLGLAGLRRSRDTRPVATTTVR